MRNNVLNFKRIIRNIKNGDHAALNEIISKRAELDATRIGNGTLNLRVAAYRAACDWENEAMKPERDAAQTTLIHAADAEKIEIARANTDDRLGEMSEFVDVLYDSELLADGAQRTLGELIDFINAQVSACDSAHRKKLEISK